MEAARLTTQREAIKRWISGSKWFWLLEQYKGRFAKDTLDMMEAFVAALHRGDLTPEGRDTP